MPTNRTYLVSGMTCGRCAGKITDQVKQIRGVIDVDVDLATGGITVTTESPVSDVAVQQAVEHAGYQLTAT